METTEQANLRLQALQLAIQYFEGKTVTPAVFNEHLQITYNFLLTGKV